MQKSNVISVSAIRTLCGCLVISVFTGSALTTAAAGKASGPLTLSLRLKDKQGNTLAVGEMGVEPFGDSDASRTQDASLEHECVENVSSVEIMKATEASEGYQTDLPLSVFDPQYYRPLPVSVAGGKAS